MKAFIKRVVAGGLFPAAGLIGVATLGCSQDEFASAAGGQQRISQPAPPRGGDSPAVNASARGRADGGTDVRRTGDNAARYTLAYPTGERETSVVLLEASGPQQVRVGQPYSYELRVTNLTDTPLHNVRVRDLSTGAPPADYERAAAAEAREASDRAGANANADADANRQGAAADDTWTIGTIPPRQTVTRQFRGVADEVGTLSNCLAVTYDPTLCIAIQAVQPQVQIVKEGPSDVLICQDITYTYRVTNTGSGNAENVVVTDTLDEGLQTERGDRQVTINVGTLRQGESKTATAKVRAQRTGEFGSRAVARIGGAPAQGAVTAAAGEGRAEGEVAQSRQVTTTVREPVLAVEVEGPEAQYVGQAVNFRVTVRNTGDARADKSTVRLAVAGAAEGQTTREIGVIEPGQARTFSVTTTPARASDQVTLTATAEAVCARPVNGNAAVAIRTVPALQLETVDGTDPIQVGQTTIYTITVRNEGSGPDRDVRLKATLPAELKFVRGAGASQVTADGQNLTFGPIATLAPGAAANWTVEVAAQRPGDVLFRLELQSASVQQPATETEPTKIIATGPGGAAKDQTATPAGQQPSQGRDTQAPPERGSTNK